MRLAFSVAVATSLVLVIAACVGDDPATSGPDVTTPDSGTPMPNAAKCSAGTPCANGSPCVDGYCCDGACAGTCEACNVAGKEGRCSAVTGKPTHGSCTGDATGPCAGSCDGKTRAACTYPEVTCGTAATCAGGTATLPSTCKAGSCPASTTQTCSLGCLEDGCLGVTQVAAGYYHACAVLTDKKVRCWGHNDLGEAGQTSPTTMLPTPVEVPGLSGVLAVAATFQASCALINDGAVKCWGSNSSGELGNGSTDSLAHPTPMPVLGISGATALGGSSSGHFCAIVDNGAIKCWGANGSGQLGSGAPVSAAVTSPVSVCQPGSTTVPCTLATGATFVTGGDTHTCAIFAGGKVACWGANAAGQLGQTADAVPHLFPAFVASGLTATQLTAGNQITCAASGGTAKCFGGNGSGRLGNGQDNTSAIVPTAVCTKQDCSAVLMNVTQVTTFDESSCALAGGAVKCWGTNTGGQLGDGNATASQNYAATSAIAAGAVSIASGGGAHYAVVVDRANRDVRCWGEESFNQCGDGTTSAARPTPISPKW